MLWIFRVLGVSPPYAEHDTRADLGRTRHQRGTVRGTELDLKASLMLSQAEVGGKQSQRRPASAVLPDGLGERLSHHRRRDHVIVVHTVLYKCQDGTCMGFFVIPRIGRLYHRDASRGKDDLCAHRNSLRT
jgi:hypothetical protein